jgi:hypothetical protein
LLVLAESRAQAGDARVQAVGVTTAALNAKLQALTSANLGGGATLTQIAAVLKVAQGQVAPAVAQLYGSPPALSVAQFQQRYSGAALSTLLSQAQSA